MTADFNSRKRLILDLWMIAATSGVVGAIAVVTDAFERLYHTIEPLGDVNELLMMLVFLPLAFAYFTLRRWQEMKAQAMRSAAAEARIAEQNRVLLEREERLELLAHATGDVVWDWDIASDRLWWSDNLYEVFGYSRDEIEPDSTSWIHRLHPEDVAAAQRFLKQGLADHPVEISIEFRFRHEDGRYSHMLSRGEVFYDPSDRPVRVLGVMMDISELKQAQEKLRHSYERFQSLATNLPDVVWVSDRQGRTPYVSPNVERVCGYTSEEMCAHPERFWLGAIRAPQLPGVVAAYEALFAQGKPFDLEYEIQRKDGQWIWVHDRSFRTFTGEDGNVYAEGIFYDITPRKHAEEDLRRSYERYQSLVANLPEVVWTRDRGGDLIYVSGASSQIDGYTVAETCSPGAWFARIHPQDLPGVRTR